MSDRIRQILQARQDSIMPLVEAGLIDLNSDVPIEEQLRRLSEQGQGTDHNPNSIAGQVMGQQAMPQMTMQDQMASGDTQGLMSPMISSVVQLDR